MLEQSVSKAQCMAHRSMLQGRLSCLGQVTIRGEAVGGAPLIVLGVQGWSHTCWQHDQRITQVSQAPHRHCYSLTDQEEGVCRKVAWPCRMMPSKAW